MSNLKLAKQDILQILSEDYNLKAQNLKKINNSSTECYIAECEDNNYFIKTFNNHKNTSKIIQEDDILKRLKKDGFNVPTIIPTTKNKIYTSYNDCYLFLENFIKGYSYTEGVLPHNLLIKSGKLLGQMHKSLHNKYDDPEKELYWKQIDIIKEEEFLDSVIEMLEKDNDNQNHHVIKEAIDHKRRMLKELKKLNDKFDGMTYLMTHGDYSERNIICDKDKIVGVVDFSDSGVYPASWELIRSYFFSTDSCKNDDFNYDLFNEYIEAYTKEFKLNEKDFELMPYLFLYQILLSRYGYREYLQNKEEKILDFIKWKEDITYFLEKNASSLVKRLKIHK